jgi:hypothetical protein
VNKAGLLSGIHVAIDTKHGNFATLINYEHMDWIKKIINGWYHNLVKYNYQALKCNALVSAFK